MASSQKNIAKKDQRRHLVQRKNFLIRSRAVGFFYPNRGGKWPQLSNISIVDKLRTVVVSSDEHTPLVDLVLDFTKQQGFSVEYIGPPAGQSRDWTEVSLAAAGKVSAGLAAEAVVMCWTGTGAVLAANKVAGVRAALCADASTARGARVWNHANVLGLSLRATALPVAKEILEAWFETPFSDDEWNLSQIAAIRRAEANFSRDLSAIGGAGELKFAR